MPNINKRRHIMEINNTSILFNTHNEGHTRRTSYNPNIFYSYKLVKRPRLLLLGQGSTTSLFILFLKSDP